MEDTRAGSGQSIQPFRNACNPPSCARHSLMSTGHRHVTKGTAHLAWCPINSPELEFDSALELNTSDTSSIYI